MLGKLMKHEWRSIWKVPTILIVVLQVIAVIAGATFAYPFWKSDLGGLEVLFVIIWMLFYFAVIGVNLGIMIYLAVHFYKSMFTDEGYLTHTLPVTPRQLLISKILPMAAWIAIGSLAICVSVAIFGGMAVAFMKPDDVTFWAYIGEAVAEIWVELEPMFEHGFVSFLLSIIVLMIVGMFSGTMQIVGSISLGQMLGKHKILGSIGAYFAINTVIQILTTVIMIPFMNYDYDYEAVTNIFELMSPIYWAMGIMSVILTVGLYFLSEFFVSRKLNLD